MAKKSDQKGVAEFDVLAFGNVSLDVIKTPSDRKEMLGGAIYYGAFIAQAIGANWGVVTKSAPKDKEKVLTMPIDPKKIYWVESKDTVSILNDYKDNKMEKRDCFNQGVADIYKKEDFPPFKAKVIQYEALVQGETDLPLLKWLASQAPLVVDAAGLIRKIMPDKQMASNMPDNLKEVFPLISFFKTDAAEAQFLTKIDTETREGRVKAAQEFLKWGAKEVLLSYNEELLAMNKDGMWTAPFRNRNLSGRTGRGDTAITSYVIKRFTMPPKDAVRFAAAATSLKMETPGPFKGTLADIEKYIKDFYSDI